MSDASRPIRPSSSNRWIPIGAAMLALALVATIVLGVARLVGPAVRANALVAVDIEPTAESMTFADAPDGAVFFTDRDRVTVRVPRDMTVAELLALYHLENNAAARAALSELGAADEDAALKEGLEVTFGLTTAGGGGE